MNVFALMGSLNREQRNAFMASFLGWTLDAGCLRLLPAHIRHASYRQRFSSSSSCYRFHHYTNVVVTPVGSTHFRYPCRPLRPTHSPDDRHHLLFSVRIAHRFLAKLFCLLYTAWTIWDCYGWRMRPWFFVGYGVATNSIKRTIFRHTPA